LFLTVVLIVWATMHLYVFLRLASVPFVAAHLTRRTLVVAAIVLWASYPLARILNSWSLEALTWPLEFVAANWIGVLFLTLSALLFTDVITLGGWLLPRYAPGLRGLAAVAAVILSVVALVQGLRPPVVRDYMIELAGLPRERDGLELIVISDTHLGTLIGRRWMERLVNRVNGMRPDLVLVVGDLMEGDNGQAEPFRPVLMKLRAPLGVWAVTGNHEYYAGLDRSVRFLEGAGYKVLRDRWTEIVSGLVLAGVDDLTARRRSSFDDRPVEKTLANRPPGATIFMSHTPWQAGTAAAAGVGLMISGHTHNGQIWPFNYIARLNCPLLGGRYEVGGMTVIVCRGTGTWGPRMRLWLPSEIVRIRLKAKVENTGHAL
jgi:hypothetical protein